MRSIASRALVIIAAALATSKAAHATEPVIVALDYSAAPSVAGCPDASALEEMIAERLGYRPFRPDAPRRVTVHLRPNERGLEGSIEWHEHLGRAPGERRFATPTRDCAAMAKTLAFALTVELQMLASLADEPPDGNSPLVNSSEPSKPAPPATGAAPVIATASDRERAGAVFGTGVSAAMGLTPGNALGARIFVSGHRGRLALEVDFESALPSTTATVGGPSFSHHLLATTAGGCYEPAWLSACALAQAARMSVRGVGVDTPMTSSGWAFASGLRAAASKRLGDRFFVRGRVEALAAVTTLTVTLNHEAAWTRPRIAASLGVDLGMRFR